MIVIMLICNEGDVCKNYIALTSTSIQTRSRTDGSVSLLSNSGVASYKKVMVRKENVNGNRRRGRGIGRGRRRGRGRGSKLNTRK